MRLLLTGICGFVGSELVTQLVSLGPGAQILGLDNLSRPGSEINRAKLKHAGVQFFHGDVRNASDFESLPPVDWVIDCSANPSVLAGVDGKTSSRQLIEHNLLGTVNLLEYCRKHSAGFALISTSRVYSVPAMASIPVASDGDAFAFDSTKAAPRGCSAKGIAADFSTDSPLSLYGASKLASEVLAREYGHTFSLPVIINRCGVMAGAGQFGTAEQGIFSYWIRSYAARRPLKYIGFDGSGKQVRDVLHPRDLAALLAIQLQSPPKQPGVWNVSGGIQNSMSLKQLSNWCADRFGQHAVTPISEPRPFDAPWIVLDASEAMQQFSWRPTIDCVAILEEIAQHHEQHPEFLELSSPA